MYGCQYVASSATEAGSGCVNNVCELSTCGVAGWISGMDKPNSVLELFPNGILKTYSHLG
ncbi:hypothetical protein AOV_04130 [Anaplasma ovis str. Haibei]|uniref:Uncharacterized protein n=1 Tax=Anaplasma ovis str. Haibei TaxID=1248439 RepID=A0A2Z2LC51_9RICK|nr:hypothetical protein AOV_04130 [Anaplasma ovis str. Haibei]